MIQKKNTELILLPSLKAHIGPNNGMVMTRKYMEGAMEFAKFWPGQVTTLAFRSSGNSTEMDPIEVFPGDSRFPIEVRPSTEKQLSDRISGSAAVLAHLSRYEEPTAEICERLGVPSFFTSEYTPKTERQIIDASVRNPVVRFRRKIWIYNAERARMRILRKATGLQCSGTPTYERYKSIQRNTMLFFDNRVRQEDIIDEIALNRKFDEFQEQEVSQVDFWG